MAELSESEILTGKLEDNTALIDSAALQERIRISSRPYQDEKFAETRKSATSEEVYLGILGLDNFPQTEDDLPGEITLPYQLSDHLLAVRASSLEAGREKSEIVRWSPQGNFQFGRVSTGSEKGVFDLERPIRTSRFARQRPIVDFHTHPFDPTIFSYTDLRNLLKARNSAYMTMLGTPRGGLALLATAQFQPRSALEAFNLTDGLKIRGYSPHNLPKSTELLSEEGLGTYEWKSESLGKHADVGVTLRKII